MIWWTIHDADRGTRSPNASSGTMFPYPIFVPGSSENKGCCMLPVSNELVLRNLALKVGRDSLIAAYSI